MSKSFYLNILLHKCQSGVCFTKFRHQLFIVISKKKLTAEKLLRMVRKVADAENGSAFLNMEFNGSAKSTEKAPLIVSKMHQNTDHWFDQWQWPQQVHAYPAASWKTIVPATIQKSRTLFPHIYADGKRRRARRRLYATSTSTLTIFQSVIRNRVCQKHP